MKPSIGVIPEINFPTIKKPPRHCRNGFRRREGDSNPRYAFGVYTLSRRASSTTRASLHRVVPVKTGANIIHFSGSAKVFAKNSAFTENTMLTICPISAGQCREAFVRLAKGIEGNKRRGS